MTEPMPKSEWKELGPDDLRWRYDPAELGFESIDAVAPEEGIVGQARAQGAIALGLSTRAQGFHLFVAGAPGQGRAASIARQIASLPRRTPPRPDRCYVANFRDPDRPRLLVLPRGEAPRFKREVEGLVERSRDLVRRVLDGEEIGRRRDALVRRYRIREEQALAQVAERASEAGFALVPIVEDGDAPAALRPVIGGAPRTEEELAHMVEMGELDEQALEKLEEASAPIRAELEQQARRTRRIGRERRRALERLERASAAEVAKALSHDLKMRWDEPPIRGYLKELEEKLVDDLPALARAPSSAAIPHRFRVNVLCSGGEDDEVPVVVETEPTPQNLFGTLERGPDHSGRSGDFTRLRPGSLLRADGGYLILNARDVIRDTEAWGMLKRALKAAALTIPTRTIAPGVGETALRPEPIPIDVKVVLTGDQPLYYSLWNAEEDFRETFKVLAEFDYEVPFDREAVKSYVAVLARIVHDEGLKPLDAAATAALVEYGVQKAGRRGRLSTRFGDIADMIREADWWAVKAGAARIDRDTLYRAMGEWTSRHMLTETKVKDRIRENLVAVDVAGARVGQVNGLLIFNHGYYLFGHAARITAVTAMGRAGVINIERESALGGPNYNKGVLILAGYLRHRFAQDKPLALSASICFEQYYNPIDGDSASLAELCALLSSLSGFPVKQGVAITGSVNQLGDIQVVGGVNRKIEGFFDTCLARGLTGEQGVVVPLGNGPELLLRDDLVQAVADRRFHVWPVENADQAIEVLTGVAAGERDPTTGLFPEGSVNGRADRRLRALAQGLREFTGGGLF